MKTQAINSEIQTLSPNGELVDGVDGALVHFLQSEHVADDQDRDAQFFLNSLLSLNAILSDQRTSDVRKPITRLALPESKQSQSNLDNALWLGNAILAEGSSVDVVDLTQASALVQQPVAFGMSLLSSNPGWIVAVESERKHISIENRRDINMVKRMLTATNATAISVAPKSVSLIEKHVAYTEGTNANYGPLYMAA